MVALQQAHTSNCISIEFIKYILQYETTNLKYWGVDVSASTGTNLETVPQQAQTSKQAQTLNFLSVNVLLASFPKIFFLSSIIDNHMARYEIR